MSALPYCRPHLPLVHSNPLNRRASLKKGNKAERNLYDGLDLIDDSKATFLHGAGIDEPLEFSNKANGKRFGYLQDHLGSTTGLMSANGQVQTRYDYKSYGDFEGDVANSSQANPYTYTGRELDPNGLMYYRNRYYDPKLEIFISKDPRGDAQRYVGGNPISHVDPLGLYEFVPGTDQYTQSAFRQALSQAQNSKNSELRALAALYGAEGEKNGVSIGFSDLGKNGGETTSCKDGITVLFNRTTIGSQPETINYLSQLIIHESVHVGQIQKGFGSNKIPWFSEAWGYYYGRQMFGELQSNNAPLTPGVNQQADAVNYAQENILPWLPAGLGIRFFGPRFFGR